MYVFTNNGHKNFVNAVCAIEGSHIFSGSDDMNIYKWEQAQKEGKLIKKLEKSDGIVSSIVSHSQQIYIGTNMGKLFTIDYENDFFSEKKIGPLINPCIQAIFVSSKYIFVGTKNVAIACFNQEGVKLELVGHNNSIRCLCGTNDGNILISGSLDKTIMLWRIEKISKYFDCNMLRCSALDCDAQIFRGHKNWVRCVCVSDDNSRIISGSMDKTIRIWDMTYHRTVMILKGHEDAIRALCISEKGRTKQIISGGQDNCIIIWDLDTGVAIRTINEHTNWVTSLTMIPNTEYFVSASSDKKIKIWNVTVDVLNGSAYRFNPKILAIMCHGTCLIVRSSNYIIGLTARERSELFVKENLEISCICIYQGHIIAGTRDGTIITWELGGPEYIRQCSTNEQKEKKQLQTINCIYSCNGEIISGSEDKTAIVWRCSDMEYICLKMHDSAVLAIVSFQCDDLNVYVTATKEYIYIWKPNLSDAHTTKLNIFEMHKLPILATFDNKYLFASQGNHKIRSWKIDSASLRGKYNVDFCGHTNDITALCYYRGLVSASSDKVIMIWNPENGNCLRTLYSQEPISCLYTSLIVMDEMLVGGSVNGTIYFWSFSEPDLLDTSIEITERYHSQVFAPIRTILCIGDSVYFSSYNRILECNKSKDELFCVGKDHKAITCMCATRSSIITGSEDGKIIQWKFVAENKQKIKKYTYTSEDNNPVHCIYAFHDEIISGHSVGIIRFWKLIDRSLIDGTESQCKEIKCSNFEGNDIKAVIALLLKVDGKKEIFYVSACDKHIYVWRRGDSYNLPIESGHDYQITALTDYGNTSIFTGSDDYTIKSWSIPDLVSNFLSPAKPPKKICAINTFRGHEDHITALCCNSRFLISSAKDKIIIIWHPEKTERIRTLYLQEAVSCLCLSHDHELVSCTVAGTIRRWDLSVGENLPSDDELSQLLQLYNKDERQEDVIKLIERIENSGMLKTLFVEGMSLAHWLTMKRLSYRRFLSKSLLPKHPEIFLAFDDCKKNLLNLSLESNDPRFIFEVLSCFSSYKNGELMKFVWHDHYATLSKTPSNYGNLVLDIEELAQVLEKFWSFSSTHEVLSGYLKLQSASVIEPGVEVAPMVLKYRQGSNSIAQVECMQSRGSEGLLEKVSWDNIINYSSSTSNTEIQTKACSPELKQDNISSVSGGILVEHHFVPFFMRECVNTPGKHSSSRLIEACLVAIHQTKNLNILKSDVLRALLDHKWKKFGFKFCVYYVLYYFSLLLHFGLYCTMRPTNIFGIYSNYIWSALLVVHTIFAVFVQLTLFVYMRVPNHKIEFFVNFLAFLSIYATIFFDESYEEVSAILMACAFLLLMVIFMFSVKNFLLPGLFVRMIAQIVSDIRNFVVLLLVFLIGFGFSLYILFYNIPNSPIKSNDVAVSAHASHFQTFWSSLMTLYFAMGGGGADWTIDEFVLSPSYFTATIFYVIFTLFSIILLNITIAMMSRIHEKVMNEVIFCSILPKC